MIMFCPEMFTPMLIALLKKSHVTLSICIFVCCAIPVMGKAQQPMTFTGYAPPMPEIEGTAWFIFGDGVIDGGTSSRLESFLADHHVPHPSSIYLNSDGGSLVEGMKLGRVIRQHNLFTYVGRAGNKIF
jgi:hypothetical protein